MPGPGVIVNPQLTRAFAVSLKFEPSMGIMARRVDKLGMDIRSFREPLERAIKEVMIPSFQRNFDEGGRPEPWDPVTDITQRRKDREGAGTQTLVRKGTLKRNMSYVSMWTISIDSAYIKDLPDRIWYGKVHQQGAEFEFGGGFTGGVPARPFIVAQREDIDDIEDVFAQWLEERIARAGLGRGPGGML